MKKYFICFCIICCLSCFVKAQNVGINSSGSAPATSAMLDIDVSSLGATAKKGLLIPRIALLSVTDVATIPSPATSLMVYNTTAASSGTAAVYPGYYYYDGSVWVAFSGGGSKDWALLGNAGTVAGTNFLGTTDNVDLQFRVNNIQGGKINIANNQTYFGYQAGLATTGISNSFFGNNTGIINTTGVSNTGMGYNTLSNSNSSYNTAVGVTSLRNLTSGGSNTFMGVSSGFYFTSGSGNTGIGMYAAEGGNGAGTGAYNTAIGYAAGSGYNGTPNYLPITSGSYNSFLGYGSAITPGTINNASAIGAYALAEADNVMVLGGINGVNTATVNTNVLIGRTSNFAANVPMVFTSSALQIDNSSANRNGLYIRNTGTGGSAGIGSYSQNYIGVFGTTQNSFGMYGGVVGTPTGNAYGVGGTSIVNGTGVPLIITPGQNVGVVATSTASGFALYATNTSAAGWAMYSNGDAGKTAGTAWIVSDKNLKTDIKPIENVLEKVIAMQPITYKFKKEYGFSDDLKIGFLSQDVQKLFPSLVKEKTMPTAYQTSIDGKQAMIAQQKLPETALYMDMESMTPILFQAIKEQQLQIEALKIEIQKLKNEK